MGSMTQLKEIAIGIDVGGTNTEMGFIDRTGSSIWEIAVPTAQFDQPDDFVRWVHETVEEQLPKLKDNVVLKGIGIGAPNGNFYNGTIEYAPNLAWKGVINLIKLFNQYFQIPVYVTNDANAATLGEMLFGAAQGMRDFVMVTLGTGVGSGFVANGELIYGHSGFAGELGHTIIERDGRECGCGRHGCLETYASVTGIVRTAKILLANYSKPSVLREVSADTLTGKTITEAAREGDALAVEMFDYTAKQLGFALANTIAITNPEAIILFGGLAKSGDLLLHPTRVHMESYVPDIFKNKVKLLTSGIHDRNAAVLGAGALVWQELEKRTSHEIKLN